MMRDFSPLNAELRLGEDRDLEPKLRPQSLSEYIGQSRLKEKLNIFIAAAKHRSESLDHCLFSGPPGLGKTTLANIMATELGVGFKSTSGPAIERPGDLAAILTNLEAKDVLFIDEIHRLSTAVEEVLYPAMEDFQLDIIIGQGPSAKSIKIDLPPFTLVGATTRAGLLTSPLRDRFGVVERLDFYSREELGEIVLRSAHILNVAITSEGAHEISRRSRGTPRIANRLLKRARDFAQVRASGLLDAQVAHEALNLLEIDHLGFDEMDRKILFTLIDKFGGGPVGLETLSSSIAEAKDTIEDVYEPYLLQQGFLQRSPRGRIATERAYLHLGRTPPQASEPTDGLQNKLFDND